jgi:RHS repeat-associated protein
MTSQCSRPCGNLCLLLAVFVLTTGSIFSQTTAARPDRGTRPNASYSVSDIENISLQNGNVNLNIPLAGLPPIAGGKLSWTLNAQYNSKVWDVVRTQQIGQASNLSEHYYVLDSVQQSDRGGWRITGQYQMEIRNATSDFNYQLPPVADPDYPLMVNYNWYKVLIIMPDGSEHELRPLDYAPFPGGKEFLYGYYSQTPYVNGTMRYYSYDGSYVFATIAANGDWTIYLPDGTRVTQSSGIQRIQDTNGNKIKIFSDTNGTHYQDELTGREIRYFYDPAGNSGKGQGQVWYQTVGSTWMHIDINFDTTTIQGKLYTVNDWIPGQLSEQPCTHQVLLSQAVQVVREIVSPQTEASQPGRRFSFTYNSDATESATDSAKFSCSGSGQSYTRTVSKGWGALSKVVTPAGAQIQYSYRLDSGNLEANKVFSPDDIPGETISKKTIVHDGSTDGWTYEIWPDLGSASKTYLNDNSVISENSYPQMASLGSGYGGVSYAVSGLVYRTTSPFRRVERHWTNLIFSGAQVNSPGGTVVFNPVVDAEYTTLTDAQGSSLKMSAKTFQYDYNGNITQTSEYDWFDPAMVSRDSNGVPTAVPAGQTPVRTTTNTYYNSATTGTAANVYAKRAIATGAPLILNAAQQTTLGPSIVQLSYDNQAYGVAPTIGNLTTKKVWDDLDAKWITTSSTYDVYGNVNTTTDARNKQTLIFYEDATHAMPTRVVVDPQNTTGAQTTLTAYDYSTGLVTSQTDVNGQISTISYVNQLLGTVDPFGRPGVTKAPAVNIGGINRQRSVSTTYKDSTRQVIVAIDLNAENDQLLKTRSTTDQLGRPTLTEQTEDGTNYTISVRNAYLDMGRVTLSSSAMRSTAANTDSWTRVTKDTAGRVLEIATFAGATQPAWSGTTGIFTGVVSNNYDAQFMTVTDQAGKVRRSMVDGLGRLIRVDEPDANGSLGTTASPVQPTNYGYDVFGNLTSVTQGTPQQQSPRIFTYDSLSRLRSANNPESGTINYQYDDAGNLLVKTDARLASAHFEYDGINRVTRRWYNGSNSTTATTQNSPALPSGVGATDEVKFYYDTQTLPIGAPSDTRGSAIGRLVAQTYGTGSNGDYYAYDVLGRQTVKYQQVGSINYQLSASYSLSGAVNTLTYPSGRTITNTYDNAGRLTALNGALGDGSSRTYTTGILYSPLGALVKEQFGTNTAVYNKLFYNSRGQLAEIRESTSYTDPNDTTWNRGAIINHYSNQCWGMCSGSSMTDNNGNLQKQEVYIPNDDQISSYTLRWQQYDYDSLNRLNWVREIKDNVEQWKQQFTYDRWSNRTINGVTYGVGINNKSFSVDIAHNRLGVGAGQSGTMTYDAAGNLTNDTYTGAGNRTYDAENKITSAWGGNNQAQLYTYDASGQRIKRTVDGVQTWQIYGFGGELVAEYAANGAATSPQKEYGYRNGQLLVTADAPVAGTTQNVTWTGTVGVSISGNNLTRTLTGDSWNAGARSTQSLASGDGYAEFTATETNKKRSVGLTHNASVTSYTNIDFGMILGSDGVITIQEGAGVFGAFGTYATGDIVRVSVEGGVVKYRKNGTLLRTSTVAPTYPLYAGAALYTNGSTVTNALFNVGGSTSAQLHWLITDHLGTPRMILDQSGALNKMTRHDYLPFGEELFTPTSGRTASQGYASDGIRHRFTQKEGDSETGLDYFQARYYAPASGRFISPDPLLASAAFSEPQSWNRYSYCLDNPLQFVDPLGLRWYKPKGAGDTGWEPVWFDEDPTNPDQHDGYELLPDGYAYYGGEGYGWIVLDGYNPNWESGFETREDAEAYGDGLHILNVINHDQPYSISQLDSTLEMSNYISGIGATAGLAARLGAKALLTEGAELATEAAVSQTARAVPQVILNRLAGKEAEAVVGQQLVDEGYTILGSQVSVRTSQGLRVIDHLVQDAEGNILAIEVKNGGGFRKPLQVLKDTLMETEGAVIVGKNAPDALRGSTLRIPTIVRSP